MLLGMAEDLSFRPALLALVVVSPSGVDYYDCVCLSVCVCPWAGVVVIDCVHVQL